MRNSVKGHAQVEENSSYTRAIIQGVVPVMSSMNDCFLDRAAVSEAKLLRQKKIIGSKILQYLIVDNAFQYLGG